MGFGVPRLGPYNPRDKKAGAEGWDGAMGVGEQFAGECLEEPVVACLGKGKKNKRGMKQKKEKERKAAVEGAGARLCEGCLWQHLQQHGERSLPAGQGWTRGQGLENQTKGSRGQCQEPAGEGSVHNDSPELGTALQPRAEEGAALAAGLCPWHRLVPSGLAFQCPVRSPRRWRHEAPPAGIHLPIP